MSFWRCSCRKVKFHVEININCIVDDVRDHNIIHEEGLSVVSWYWWATRALGFLSLRSLNVVCCSHRFVCFISIFEAHTRRESTWRSEEISYILNMLWARTGARNSVNSPRKKNNTTRKWEKNSSKSEIFSNSGQFWIVN